MTKKATNTKTKTNFKKTSNVSTKSKSNVKKVTKKKTETKSISKEKNNNKLVTFAKRVNPRISMLIIFLFGVLLIFSSFAWFSMNLNIKIKTFNMVVAKNSDLTISFDGVNFSRSIELTKKEVFEELGNIYPGYNTQWPSNGLIPVSSPGITDPSSPKFDFFETSGVLYRRKDSERGFLRTRRVDESKPREYNSYLAFDIFIKNDTGSPMSDNLYFETTSLIHAPDETDEEMQGLVNSFRVGIVKIGSVPLDASVSQIQNIECDNNCKSIIYEPNSKFHTPLSIERAKKYGVELIDGDTFPTYAYIKEGGPIYVDNSISGSSKIDRNHFTVQETLTDDELNTPIFDIPNGITKARVYVWIEGQDIDSLETNSKGTEVEISIDFIKDTAGWEGFNEE